MKKFFYNNLRQKNIEYQKVCKSSSNENCKQLYDYTFGFKVLKTFACSLIFLMGTTNGKAQLFFQNFNDSLLVNCYSQSPSNAQFDTIAAQLGSGLLIYIDTNKLRFSNSGFEKAIYVRNTNFSPVPSNLIYQFDLRINGNLSNMDSVAIWQVGSNFDLAFQTSSTAHSELILNQTNIPGNFTLSHSAGAFTSPSFSNKQRITWAINNSNSTISYRGPDGSNEAVGVDKEDVWIGNMKVFDEMIATNSTVSLTDIKFLFNPAQSTIDFDNFLIDTIPAIPIAQAATTSLGTNIINWLPVANVSGYQIDVSLDANFSSFVSPYANFFVAGQSTVQLLLNGLSNCSTYYYRVRAVNEFGSYTIASGNSATINFTAFCPPPSDPIGSITSTSFCGGATLSYPLGIAPIVYYWQTSATGTDTSFPTDGTPNYTIASSGPFYVRAKDTSTSLWSLNALSSGLITINSFPTASINGTTTVCQNSTSPSISFLGSNGSAPYTFVYKRNGIPQAPISTIGTSSSVNLSIATNLAASYTYTLVSVTDINGCTQTVSGSASITINQLPTASLSGSDTVCQFGPSQSIQFTGSGGSPYTFYYKLNGFPSSVFTSGSTASITALTNSAGTYFYVLDSVSNGCSQTQSASVIFKVNSLPTASISGTTTTCLNSTSPKIIFTGMNGTRPYTFKYHINGGSILTSSSTTGNNDTIQIDAPTISTGIFTYSLDSVYDANTCGQAQSGVATITVNNLPNASISGTATVCQNTTSPIITFAGSNGTAPYTFMYSINGSIQSALTTSGTSSTASINVPSDSAGSFNYTLLSVIDGNGCSTSGLSDNAIIIVNPSPTANIGGGDTVCQNGIQPLITFNGNFGTPPYSFMYQLNGVTQTPISTVSSGNSASINASTNFAGTFVYTLIEVTDANNCSSIQNDNIVVKVNPLPFASILGSTDVCEGSPSPKVTFTGSNGVRPYSFNYLLNGSLHSITSSVLHDTVQINVATNSAGIYQFELIDVSDANGCTQNQNGIAIVNVHSISNAVINGNSSICQFDASPNVVFTAMNGVPPYTFVYQINNNPIQSINSIGLDSVVSIAAPTTITGTFVYHLLQISDVNNCTKSLTDSAIIIVHPKPSASIYGNATSCTLPGDSLPITFIGSGGTPPYTFYYNVNGGPSDTISSNLSDTAFVMASISAAGNYVYNLYAVSDANGCNQTISGTASLVVNQSLNGVITTQENSGTIANDGILCAGDFSTLVASGGFSYLWNTGETTANININSNNFSGADSTFYVIVSVNNLCPDTVYKTIHVNPIPMADISGDTTVCSDASTSIPILLKGSNGIPPYTFKYTINSGVTQVVTSVGANDSIYIYASIANAGLLNYKLISVSDANGCEKLILDSVLINVNQTPNGSIIVSEESGNQDHDGIICLKDSVYLNATGGTSYLWNTLDTTSMLSIVPDSSKTFVYSVSIFINGNCPVTLSKNILVKPLPNATISCVDSICKNASTDITFTGSNGDAPYTFVYKRNNIQQNPVASSGTQSSINIPVATNVVGDIEYHLIHLIDSNSCYFYPDSLYKTITVNPLPTAIIIGDTAVCYNDDDPFVYFVGSSGKGPYKFVYNLNGGATDTIETAINTDTAFITVPTNIVGDFNYNLLAVIDASGCSQTQAGSVLVRINSLPVANINGSTVVCQNSASPKLVVTGSNGIRPYVFAYKINNNPTIYYDTTQGGKDTLHITAPTNLVDTFLVKLFSVSDANGCMNDAFDTATVIINPLPGAIISGGVNKCYDATNTTPIKFKGLYGKPPFTFQYKINSAGFSQFIQSIGVTDSAVVNAPLNVYGTYEYILLSVTDANGCSKVVNDTTLLIINPALNVSINVIDTSGNSLNDGVICKGSSVMLIASGGTNYIWNDLSTNDTLIKNPTITSIYTVTISDGMTCTNTITKTIVVKNLPTATVSGSEIICQNASKAINFTGAQGITPYTFYFHRDSVGFSLNDSINTNVGNSNASLLVPTLNATTYTYSMVSVKDGNGCVQSQLGNVIVKINPQPTATMSLIGSNYICQNTSLDTIKFEGSAGTKPYKFIYQINGITHTDSTGPGQSIKLIPINTNVSGLFNFTLLKVSDANNCEQNQSGNISIQVNPLPVATISGSTTTCLNSPSPKITFTGSNGLKPYTFVYKKNGLLQTSITTNASNDSIQIDALTNSVGINTYQVVSITDANGCSRFYSNDSVVIIIKDLPNASISGTDTICQNEISDTITFTGNGGLKPYTFAYSINNTLQSNITIVNNENLVKVGVSTSIANTFIYKLLTITDANGCVKNIQDSDTILVNPLPNAIISASLNEDTSFCSTLGSLPVILSASNGTKPYTFSYTINNVSILLATTSNLNDSIHLNRLTSSPGTFNYFLLSVSDANQCTNLKADTTKISILAKPSAALNISGSDTICKDAISKVNFIGLDANPPYTFYYHINNGSINHDSIYTDFLKDSIQINAFSLNPGNLVYHLDSVSSDNGCGQKAQLSDSIYINQLPTALIVGSTAVCKNSISPKVTFKGVIGKPGFTFKYSLNGGTIQTVTTPGTDDSTQISIPTNNAGTFVYKLQSITDANGCIKYQSDSVVVTVRPLPDAHITASDTVVCLTYGGFDTIQFIGNLSTKPYYFTYRLNGGVPYTLTSLPGDSIYNLIIPINVAGNFNYKLLSVSDSFGCASTLSDSAFVKVNPLPTATISGDTSTCLKNSEPLITIQGDSSIRKYHFEYTINNGASLFDSTDNVQDFVQLSQSTNTAGIFTYRLIKVTDGNNCISGTLSDSTIIIVNPLPFASISGDTVVCQNSNNPPITFIGANGSSPYHFTYKINGLSQNPISTLAGVDSTETFALTDKADTLRYNLTLVTDSNNCATPLDTTIMVVVKPAAGKPAFTAGIPDSHGPINLCKGSANMNFNVTNPIPGLGYQWNSTGTGVIFPVNQQDNPNVVATFTENGEKVIVLQGDRNGCTDTSNMIVNVAENIDEIHLRKIFLKQPGNLLIYPDNSMDTSHINGTTLINGYQWGYDTIFVNDSLGKPVIIDSQVYQIFIPNKRFLTNDQTALDTNKYAFWVLLKNGDCQSRIYYNGPYAFRFVAPIESERQDVMVSVNPNPSSGEMNLSIQGNIYGSLNVKIFDYLGQAVHTEKLIKKTVDANYPLHLRKLTEGVYLLELSSKDEQRYLLKLSIHH